MNHLLLENQLARVTSLMFFSSRTDHVHIHQSTDQLAARAFLSTSRRRHEVKVTLRKDVLLLGHPTNCHSGSANPEAKHPPW